MGGFLKNNSPTILTRMSDTAVVRLRDGTELWTAVSASRTVLDDAGHAPWAERPTDTRSLIIDALKSAPSAG